MGVKTSKFLQLRGVNFFWNNPFQYVLGSKCLDPGEIRGQFHNLNLFMENVIATLDSQGKIIIVYLIFAWMQTSSNRSHHF